VLDLDRVRTVELSTQRSKCRNAPYQGWRLKGAPILTLVGGRIVFDARS
jgi:dihydroorotase